MLKLHPKIIPFQNASTRWDQKFDATLEPHCLHTANNHMTDTVPPPTLGGSRTTTFSSDIYITENMNMQPAVFSPYYVCFVTKIANKDNPPSLSFVPTLQVGQALTNIVVLCLKLGALDQQRWSKFATLVIISGTQDNNVS